VRHHRAGKKLGRDSSHRKALYANLACSLIEHGRIKTTEAKAKAVKPFAEQMITLGKRGDLHARRQALSHLRSQEIVHRLFADVSPRFAERPGGYSRIVKLGRDSAHRRALYANLAGSLIEHGRIKTTEAKAKAVKPFAEQMITLGKRGDLAARRQAIAQLRSQDVVHVLFSEVAPRFAERPGGYTRIVKLGPRAGDAAEMVYLELGDYDPAAERGSA